MGGGSQQKKTNNMLDQDRANQQQQNSQFMGTVNSGIAGATQRASDMYGSLSGGYNRFINGDDDYKGSLPGGGGGGGYGAGDPRFGDVEGSYRNFMSGGGIDTGRFNQFQGHLGELAASGGWSPEHQANVMGDVNKMRATADDQDIANRFRGNGVFDEFAKTGGYSDRDISNIRSRANSVIPAYYDVARNEASRMGSVQGGYGPGQGALFARMGRDQARGAASTALDAELGIKDKVNAGRQWGGGQMSSAENALQTMRMNALTGASGAEGNMVNSIAQNRIGAANAGAGNETGMQGEIQKGKMFGTQGLEGMAESAAARAAAAGAASSADAKWQANFNREGREYGLEGMQSLYGSHPGEVDMYLGHNEAGRGIDNSTSGRIIDQRMQNNPRRDWASTIGTIAGAAGGAMTGLGALGVGSKAIKAGAKAARVY
jgi:hypothetical protein